MDSSAAWWRWTTWWISSSPASPIRKRPTRPFLVSDGQVLSTTELVRGMALAAGAGLGPASGRFLAGQGRRGAASVWQFASGYFEGAHPAGLGAADLKRRGAAPGDGLIGGYFRPAAARSVCALSVRSHPAGVKGLAAQLGECYNGIACRAAASAPRSDRIQMSEQLSSPGCID